MIFLRSQILIRNFIRLEKTTLERKWITFFFIKLNVISLIFIYEYISICSLEDRSRCNKQ